MTPQITVDRNYITIQDVKVERPQTMSPSQWLEFWDEDRVTNLEELEDKLEGLKIELQGAQNDYEEAVKERDEVLEDVKKLQAKIKAVEDALY